MMADVSSDLSSLPEAVAAPKSRSALSLVWLVPIIALLIGGWLVVKGIMERGPTISITFKSAEGLEAGKTKLRYKDVEIGEVKNVALAPNLTQVIATAELVKDFDKHLLADTTFWVVRARISGGSVSGLGTLLSGSYIGVDVGKSATRQHAFVGLEVPPVVRIDTPGREFVLHSTDLGSLDVGSPVFFRRLQVGQIVAYELDKDGKGVTLKTFVNAPYDKYVTGTTRFWNASGVDVTLDASGIRLETQSVVSILLGGIAFEAPAERAEQAPAEANSNFSLFSDRNAAMKNPETEILKVALVFKESIRGLAPGAALDFRGIVVGEVVALMADVDPVSKQIVMVVNANVYPERLRLRARSGQKITSKVLGAKSDQHDPTVALGVLVENGLRAQLQTGNLLTGQLFIALDFFPNTGRKAIDWSQSPPELPTIAGSLQQLQATLASIARKIDGIPMDKIGADLSQTLQSANTLLKRLDSEVAPEAVKAITEARHTLRTVERLLSAEAPLQQDAREAMRELTRTAQTFRALADALERHPEALLRGKLEDQP
jgi:paraquat-inducible protein B